MEIRYTLTISEFNEGYFVLLRNSTWRHRFFRWQFSWLGPLLGAIMIGLGLLLLLDGEKQYFWAFLFFAFGLAMLITPLRLQSSIRSQFRLADWTRRSQ